MPNGHKPPKIVTRHAPLPQAFAQGDVSEVARRMKERLEAYFATGRGKRVAERSGVSRVILEDLPGPLAEVTRPTGRLPYTTVATLDPNAVAVEEFIRPEDKVTQAVTEHELGHLYGLQREARYADEGRRPDRTLPPSSHEHREWVMGNKEDPRLPGRAAIQEGPIYIAMFPDARYSFKHPREFYAEAWRMAHRLRESPNEERASQIAERMAKGDLWGQQVAAIYAALAEEE
jgi:hypothetical protein